MKRIDLPSALKAVHECPATNLSWTTSEVITLMENYAKLAVTMDRQTPAEPSSKKFQPAAVRMEVPLSAVFSEYQIRSEMMRICGCKGQYDCSCVSIQNYALQDLWYRKNSGEEHPRPNGYQ